MRVLMVGDIVGSPGRRRFREVVGRLRRDGEAHLVVANVENAAAGSGLTPALAQELLAAGADVLTLGDHAWGRKELAGWIDAEPRVIRPLNFAPECPGRGLVTVQSDHGPLTVISLLGRVFMPPVDCPFRAIDALLPRKVPGGVPVVVDFHAEATSEKIAMGLFLDGRVAALVGTHTHVQTADARCLPGGTAYCTDLGMTGPLHSVIGREVEPVLQKFTTGMPARFEVAKGPATLEGVLIDIDPATCRARGIRAIREPEDDT